jgi:hypothetical protein
VTGGGGAGAPSGGAPSGEATGDGPSGGGAAPPGDDSDAQPDPGEEPLRWDWTVEEPPEVTIEDLASFAPDPGPVIGEPAGWGIVGLETNFYSSTRGQVIDGELLGEPASVRFTPVRWHWTYGDGAAASVSSPGAAWGSAESEFQPTAASHRYTQAGIFDVGLSVEFAAEFRFGDGTWLPVTGSVFADAASIPMRIGTADTLLVEHGCNTAAGPGC